MDFNTITYNRYIPITNMGIHSTGTLFLEGKDVTSTNTVFINGVSTKDFVILSKTKLLVDIPNSELNSPINNVSLAGSSGDVGFLTFNLNSKDSFSSSKYVIQRFFRYLFTDPGSNVFDQEEGVGLVSNMGTISFDDVEVYIASAIKQAEEYVLQTQRPELSDDKTLRMVNIMNISYSISTLTASVALQFELADGSAAITDFNVTGY